MLCRGNREVIKEKSGIVSGMRVHKLKAGTSDLPQKMLTVKPKRFTLENRWPTERALKMTSEVREIL